MFRSDLPSRTELFLYHADNGAGGKMLELKKPKAVQENLQDLEKMIMEINDYNNLSIHMNQTFKEHFFKICGTFDEISSGISALYNKSGSIGKITESIKNVSSQTNLLAINAAIEAAHAGAHGKTFTVVANEIKKLSIETSALAVSINKIIEEIQCQVNETKNLIDNEANSFGQLNFKDKEADRDLSLMGKDLEDAVYTFSDEVIKSFNAASARSNPQSYFNQYQQQIERTSEHIIGKNKIIFGVYFQIDPAWLEYLSQDCLGIGIYTLRKEDGSLEKQRSLYVRDFTRSNAYMTWYYDPVREKKGVWSSVYFDRYANKELVSFSSPVYMNDQLIGVAGGDIDYELIKMKHQEELLVNIHDVIRKIHSELIVI